MPKYIYECPACGNKQMIFRSVERRDVLPACSLHRNELVTMVRVFGTFLFTAEREADKPENQIMRIISKSNDPADWKRIEKHYAEKKEAEADTYSDPPAYKSMDDIDIAGAWTAANAGIEQLNRWRKDNIKDDSVDA